MAPYSLTPFTHKILCRAIGLALISILLIPSLPAPAVRASAKHDSEQSRDGAGSSSLAVWVPDLLRPAVSTIGAIINQPSLLLSFDSYRGAQPGAQNKGMPPTPARAAGESPRRPHSRTEREARVSKLEMNVPGDTKLQAGQKLVLSAG